MLRTFKRFSGFIDPYSIGTLFAKSKSISQVLEHFQHQKEVFVLKDHAPPLLSKVLWLKSDENVQRSLNDARFKDLLSMINSESSFEVYLDLLNQLALIYRLTNTPIDPGLKKPFNSRLIQCAKTLDISSAAKSLNIISLAFTQDSYFLKHATTIAKTLPVLCQTQSPTAQDCLFITQSLSKL